MSHKSPPKSILRLVGKAIADFQMIKNNDRILVAVSGGKDSLSLLNLLIHLQRYAPIQFELAIITVDPQIAGFNPERLLPYYEQLGLPFFYESQPIMAQAQKNIKKASFCAYCSRMKRGIMYRVMREKGYNVLALGQHLDDLAESLLMSLFHAGDFRTMKAHYQNNDGDLRIIRPLVYVREKQTAAYAQSAGHPVVFDSCPACFNKPTQREAMKTLLSQLEDQHKNVHKSMLSAMRPLLEAEVPNNDE